MKHPSNREFFAYWDDKRGDTRAPERSDIEPGAVRELLGDIFVLSYDNETGFPFRVAGTRVSALLGLGGEGYASIDPADRERPDALVLVGPGVLPPVPPTLGTLANGAWLGRANSLSPSHVPWEAIDEVDEATRKPPTPVAAAPSLAALPPLAVSSMIRSHPARCRASRCRSRFCSWVESTYRDALDRATSNGWIINTEHGHLVTGAAEEAS